MADSEAIRKELTYSISMEDYRRKEKELETACKQFEGTMFAKLWKDMMKSARTSFGNEDKKTYGALEETVVEMVSEHLSESQGVGVWKVLYDQLHERLPLPEELAIERKEKLAASAEEKSKRALRTPRTPKAE
ncbi:hypothetical protein FACS1894167_04210 [Synergistales bacterium]|nr:hypothetical protein FACS1894167_04210 [Synergistales bacterium]